MSKKKSLEKTVLDLSENHKLIVVSNRGPIQYRIDNGDLVASRGGGGLIAALDSVLKLTRSLWIAAAMSPGDREVAAQADTIGIPPDKPLYQVKLVELEPNVFDQYYNKISNRYLWYLQHYLFDAIRQPSIDKEVKLAWTNGYVAANKKFADVIIENSKKDESPIILLQDYHLYLAAGFIRRRKPKAILFHFIHIPWCCPDYLRILPTEFRRAILQSLLENNIVGFHSWRYVRNFLYCCQEFLGHKIDLRKHRVYIGDRIVRVKAYPISVDAKELTTFSTTPAVLSAEEEIIKAGERYKLIIRVDRAELSKNIVRGFEAYAHFLREHPQWQKKVQFLAFAYPTRSGIEEYGVYRQEMEAKTEEINLEFGDNDWLPIDLRISDNYPRSVAALKNYDVLLVNPIFDGMNLVAKEGAILNKKNGVILLSENAGAYDELRDGVLSINPFDIENTGANIYKALNMAPIEREAHAKRLQGIIKRNDIYAWLYHQLRDIEKLTL
ncbi:MAG TPA: trehalose-6-phosphate synthase [Actinobacteria bacterium]|nr:trehalose-6-phosphate synthase [Actinomycetes bacterium]HEX21550.1 trehalose-6-phosphate synthase [Actinomycetota bacterium]